jgi:hypothetical protein
MYLRQAETALNAARSEGKKIGTLAKKRADLSKDEAKLNAALTEALKREATADKRDADRDRRSREAQAREQEAQRREQEAQRQEDLIQAELQRQSDLTEANAKIEEVEHRMTAQIDALREPKDENLRILYATASPDGDLRVAQEIRRVKNAVSSALHRDRVDIEIAPDITSDDLLNYLTSFEPHVIHFSGHANQDVLVFDDGSTKGGKHRISIELFMRAVSAPDQKPTLVVLNACKSAANLQALLSSVPVAIGMSASVGDADAITFATRFYRSVADGQSIAASLAIARTDMEMNGLPDHDLPTLVAAPGLDPSDIRLVLTPSK